MLKNAIEGASTAHSAIAHNVVNAQTPNFHRTDVSFRDALAKANGENSDPDTLALTATDAMHFGSNAAQPFEVEQTIDTTSKMRADGGNVDIDQEMAKMSMNADYGQMSSQFLRNQYAMYRAVVTE